MPTALVFAGRSFIGRWLCRELRRRDWSVTCTGRKTTDAGDVSCDLRDAGRVDEIVRGTRPNWIFQVAGATHDADFRAVFDLHVSGTLNVLDAVRRHAPATGVLLLGSAAEYGPASPTDFPLPETHPLQPRSFFGASKAAQTRAACAAAAEWGLRVATARPFNVIGPGLPEYYFAASAAARLRRLAAEGPPREFPVVNAHATRDFIDVRDVTDALIAPDAKKWEWIEVRGGREIGGRRHGCAPVLGSMAPACWGGLSGRIKLLSSADWKIISIPPEILVIDKRRLQEYAVGSLPANQAARNNLTRRPGWAAPRR